MWSLCENNSDGLCSKEGSQPGTKPGRSMRGGPSFSRLLKEEPAAEWAVPRKAEERGRAQIKKGLVRPSQELEFILRAAESF